MFVPVDEKYENEAPFQLYWFACNCILTLLLTLLVKLSWVSLAGIIHHTLGLGNVSIVKNQIAVIAIIATIFATGVLSQILFFLMKYLKCAMPSSLEEPIELEAKDP